MDEQVNQNEALDIKALKAGDRQEIAKMVEKHSDQVYRVALKMLNNPSDAEDVLQETFIKAIRALSKFQERSSISTWLYRIAVNESLMLIRKRKPEVAVDDEPRDEESSDYPVHQIVDWCCLPEKEFMSNETRSHINTAIQNLPEKFRSVFILRDIEGLSIKETSAALDLSETNVKTRLLRARLKLREELTEYYGERMAEVKNGA